MPLNPATEAFADSLRGGLPPEVFRPMAPGYIEDPRGNLKGQAGLVLAPGTAEETAVIIRAANAARVGVVPYGGGTGLVGGQILTDGPAPVILSVERMKRVRAVHPAENVMIVEAGAILHDVHQAAEAADRLFPLWLASEGSARIGGNLATNAGGVNVLRYGTARDLCLGLEAVLPTGEIWHGLKRLRKDNTGYDLRGLLVGSEGTLGVITAATLRLFPRPGSTATALLVVPNPSAAVDLLALAQAQFAEGLSAFELIDGMGLHFLAETMPDVRQPFAVPPEWMVLIDLGLPVAQDATSALTELFEAAAVKGLSTDGTIAQSEAQRSELWAVRESIPLANRRVGAIASHDISLPISSIPKFIPRASAALKVLGDIRINCFGHLGDGNLHFNVFPAKGHNKADYSGAGDRAQRIVHDLVAEYGGSFSAEHGVGRLKVGELARYGDATKLAAMRAIKQALDPNGIMNPGVLF